MSNSEIHHDNQYKHRNRDQISQSYHHQKQAKMSQSHPNPERLTQSQRQPMSQSHQNARPPHRLRLRVRDHNVRLGRLSDSTISTTNTTTRRQQKPKN